MRGEPVEGPSTGSGSTPLEVCDLYDRLPSRAPPAKRVHCGEPVFEDHHGALARNASSSSPHC
jgi:hypothetical protein